MHVKFHIPLTSSKSQVFLWNCKEFRKYDTVCTICTWQVGHTCHCPMPFQVSRLLPFVGVVRVQESTLQTDIKIASPFSKHVHNYMFDLHMPIIFQKFEYSFGLSVSITTASSQGALHLAIHRISWLQFGPRPSDRCKFCCCWLLFNSHPMVETNPNQWESRRGQRRDLGMSVVQ